MTNSAGGNHFDNASLQPDLSDASGNILPEQERARADAAWSYYQSHQIKTLIAEIMHAMLDQGQVPTPALEDMAFSEGESDGSLEADEDTDDFNPGDDGDDIGGDDDEFDGDAEDGPTEEIDTDEEDEESELEEEEQMSDKKPGAKKVNGAAANYQSEEGKTISVLAAEIETLKKKLQDAEQKSVSATVSGEIEALNYEMGADEKVKLVGALSSLDAEPRQAVLSALKTLSPKQTAPAQDLNLSAHLYQGKVAPVGGAIDKKAPRTTADYTAIADIAYSKNVSYSEAEEIWKKGR